MDNSKNNIMVDIIIITGVVLLIIITMQMNNIMQTNVHDTKFPDKYLTEFMLSRMILL